MFLYNWVISLKALRKWRPNRGMHLSKNFIFTFISILIFFLLKIMSYARFLVMFQRCSFIWCWLAFIHAVSHRALETTFSLLWTIVQVQLLQHPAPNRTLCQMLNRIVESTLQEKNVSPFLFNLRIQNRANVKL